MQQRNCFADDDRLEVARQVVAEDGCTKTRDCRDLVDDGQLLELPMIGDRQILNLNLTEELLLPVETRQLLQEPEQVSLELLGDGQDAMVVDSDQTIRRLDVDVLQDRLIEVDANDGTINRATHHLNEVDHRIHEPATMGEQRPVVEEG